MMQLDKVKTQCIRKGRKAELERAQKRWDSSADIVFNGLSFEPGEYILLCNLRATSNAMIPKYTDIYNKAS
jgi:hypothetical protein